MQGYNKVILIGNLGRDPEIRFTTNGNSICNFTVATNRSYTDTDGNKKEAVDWHRVTAFGKLAEICGEHLSKGNPVFIEGELRNQRWKSKDGTEKEQTVVIPNNVRFLSEGNKQE